MFQNPGYCEMQYCFWRGEKTHEILDDLLPKSLFCNTGSVSYFWICMSQYAYTVLYIYKKFYRRQNTKQVNFFPSFFFSFKLQLRKCLLSKTFQETLFLGHLYDRQTVRNFIKTSQIYQSKPNCVPKKESKL